MELYRLALLICLFTSVSTQSDPCGQTECRIPGYECRLVQVSCAQGFPCPPQPLCIPSQTKTDGPCGYGFPVLDQTGENVYSTSTCDVSTNNCPDSTQCRNRVCCWTPFEVTREPTYRPPPTIWEPRPTKSVIHGGQVPGYCAKTFPLPALFCQWMVPECTKDTDCLPGSKCCYTDKCGRKGCLLARLQPECSFIDKMFGLCT